MRAAITIPTTATAAPDRARLTAATKSQTFPR